MADWELELVDVHERERFDSYIDRSNPKGCWPWLGQLHPAGYGKFSVRRDRRGRRRWTSLPAHRVAWVLAKGEMPGETLDHLCHTNSVDCPAGAACLHRRCVRPDHLQSVTMLENIARGQSGIRQLEKEYCPKGHKYSGANLKVFTRKNGRDAGKSSRGCDTCYRERHSENSREWRKRNPEWVRPGATPRIRVNDQLVAARELTCKVGGHPWMMVGSGRAGTTCPEHRRRVLRVVEIADFSVDGLVYQLTVDGALLPAARIDYDGEIVMIDDEVLLPPFKIYRNGVKVFHRKFEGHLPLGMGR